MDSQTINGLTVEIDHDDMADNPLDWDKPDDRQGRVTFALQHSRYNLPWEVGASTDDFDSWHELAEALTAKGGELAGYVYKFVRWFEHSGVNVSLTDNSDIHEWDAGCAGVVFGKTTTDIEIYFEPWAAYTSGEVYAVTVTNPKDGEIVESCCGFYSYDDAKQFAESEARAYEWPHDAKYAKDAKELH